MALEDSPEALPTETVLTRVVGSLRVQAPTATMPSPPTREYREQSPIAVLKLPVFND
jgi:hypothetical protein